MSYHIFSNSGKVAYGVKELIIDTYNDINKFNVKFLTPGTTVFVIDVSEYYMLNTQLKWVQVDHNGNGLVSDIISGEVEVIYDGGELKPLDGGDTDGPEGPVELEFVYDGGGVDKNG